MATREVEVTRPCSRCNSRCTVGAECLACGHREDEGLRPLPYLAHAGRFEFRAPDPEQVADELAGAYDEDGNRVKPYYFRRKE